MSKKSNERIWAIFSHLSAFAGFVFPLGNILAPLVIWLVFKNDPLVDKHGKESLNFQISLTIYALLSLPLVFLIVGIFALLAVLIVGFVAVVKAAVAAGNNEFYKYPFSIRLIK